MQNAPSLPYAPKMVVHEQRNPSELWAVVRDDARVPGGLRIAGNPTNDHQLAQRIASGYRRPHRVMALRDVYQRRQDALRRGARR